MVAFSSQVSARFIGSADPCAPLTWGQRALWIAMRHPGASQVSFLLRRVVTAPRRATVDVPAALRAIGGLIARHSSLRTKLCEIDGEPRQLIFPEGEQPVYLLPLENPEQDDGLTLAREAASELARTPFDYASEWPQRIALVVAGEQVRQVVIVFSHMTVDFQAAELVLRDLRLFLLRGTVPSPAPMQSVDVARLEEAARLQRRCERAIGYWLSCHDRLPADTLPRRGPALSPRFQRVVLFSEAADTAMRIAAYREQVTTSTVLHAAIAGVIAAWSGNLRCGIYTMVNNRALDGYRDAISKLNQLGLVVVDLADRPMWRDALLRVWGTTLEAYRNAYYDPAAMAKAHAEAGIPYTTGINPHCYVNDIRLSPSSDLFGLDVTESSVRAALARSTFVAAEKIDTFGARVRLEVIDAFPGLGLAVTGDTVYLPESFAERFLRDLERLLVDAAFDNLSWPWVSEPPR